MPSGKLDYETPPFEHQTGVLLSLYKDNIYLFKIAFSVLATIPIS